MNYQYFDYFCNSIEIFWKFRNFPKYQQFFPPIYFGGISVSFVYICVCLSSYALHISSEIFNCDSIFYICIHPSIRCARLYWLTNLPHCKKNHSHICVTGARTPMYNYTFIRTCRTYIDRRIYRQTHFIKYTSRIVKSMSGLTIIFVRYSWAMRTC